MDVAVFWATYKLQIIVFVAVVLLAFVVLRRIFGLLRLLIFLALGAALGWGTSYRLKTAGVPGDYAYYTAAAITVVVLLFGMRRRKE